MALKETAGLYETLKVEWNKKNPNLSKCGELLSKLKVSLLELNFLPTSGSALTKQQLILARDVLEIGALWSILKKDIPSFERYMAQLKCYYFDYKEELPEAAYMHQLLGLNLLFLLSQNRVSEFHTELERLSARDIQTNVYIRHPVSLEQYLMEGSYNKRGWSLSPDGYYSFTSQQQRTEEVTIPSTELAQQVIEYARQLEMIV
ncbi:26S proteasome non-ATPase regulatory subunit 8 [Collichthys lucidus]|uniref:26S proteasome non-ATPase regulatory subunit 8 n=1 Tax=Collichthys lucidus TaxID=240159 RepID=A0A4U5UZE9_COLLU|nr:26S proteasome non-ATPase regulatory subunit 8 [Collichthys lucidus]